MKTPKVAPERTFTRDELREAVNAAILPYSDLLSNIAILYPELVATDSQHWSHRLTDRFRRGDISSAATQIRAEEDAARAKALVAEFRGKKA